MAILQDGYNGNSNMGSPLLLSVKKTFRGLLRIWWVFAIVGILGGIAGIIYSTFDKPQYVSESTFALDDGEGAGIGNILNLASQFGINVGGGKDIFAGDNILQIIKSRRILEQVLTSVDTFDNKPYTLIQYYLDKKGRKIKTKDGGYITFPTNLNHDDYSYKQDSVLLIYYQSFAKNLVTAQRPDRKLSLYEVRVTTPDEKLSKVFTEKLLAATNDLYIQIRTKKAKQTLDILENRVAQLKGGLKSSINERAQVQDINLNPAFEKAEIPVLNQQTNIQVYSAAYAELFKNLELARFQYLDEIPLMQIIDKPQYPMTKIKMSKLFGAILFVFIAEAILLLVLAIRYVLKD